MAEVGIVDVQEYEYGPPHLKEAEALDRFAHEKMLHPDALVTLDELDCGNWSVHVYESPEEKQHLVRTRLTDLFESFFRSFRR